MDPARLPRPPVPEAFSLNAGTATKYSDCSEATGTEGRWRPCRKAWFASRQRHRVVAKFIPRSSDGRMVPGQTAKGVFGRWL